MTRRTLLILFGLVTVLGLVGIFLGGTGRLMAIGATGPVYGILDAHGLAGDEVLVGELYAVVMALVGPFSLVQYLGAAVTLLGGIGVWMTLKQGR